MQDCYQPEVLLIIQNIDWYWLYDAITLTFLIFKIIYIQTLWHSMIFANNKPFTRKWPMKKSLTICTIIYITRVNKFPEWFGRVKHFFYGRKILITTCLPFSKLELVSVCCVCYFRLSFFCCPNVKCRQQSWVAISNSYCCWRNHTPDVTLEMLRKAYTYDAMKEAALYECHKHFCSRVKTKPGYSN